MTEPAHELISFGEDSPEDATFRKEVRAWFADNLTDDLKNHIHRQHRDLVEPWHRKLYEQGWIAPHWPTEFGGMGATVDQQVILMEETVRASAPNMVSIGLNFVGPCLMECGSPEQQQRHLPPLLAGDIFWAQGYSEPNSGSDLASLQTRAVPDGDGFIVNGQKIWTTWAQHCDWLFTLVRTSTEGRKHAGISVLLIDITSPGVKVEVIDTIANDPEYCQVFLDDVRVPKENLVGDINDGWNVANRLLRHERLTGGNPQDCMGTLARVRLVADATGAINDPAFADRLVEAELKVVSLIAAFSHMVDLKRGGMQLGPDTSMLKIFKADTVQELTDLLIDAAGANTPSWDRLPTATGVTDVSELYLQSRRATIYGGAQEVQRGIVAKRVLSLP